ncbi:uncharacterized protein LOC131432813 [Malaya genurostris]|uniref:uncharacterized protein LOC131432813 n=1 Tax=Malaya genurostris TaxID=325434 RepID=UPI0026F3D7BD|nr:uncharacterized protein LOC131432813 [Malaya genurostris]
MHSFFLLSYAVSVLGLLLSLVYWIMDSLRYRTLSRIAAFRQRSFPAGEERTLTRKYVSRYRTKMFQRKLINEINRINANKLRIKPSQERYELYYDSEGTIRLRTTTKSSGVQSQ